MQGLFRRPSGIYFLRISVPTKVSGIPQDTGGLSGDRAGFYSVTVQANWRLTFRFVGEDVELLDYLDYH